MLPFGVNCRLQLAVLEKREEGAKPTLFISKATSLPQGNHPHNSSPVEALHLIESISLPADVNNSTTELHLGVEAKECLLVCNTTPCA